MRTVVDRDRCEGTPAETARPKAHAAVEACPVLAFSPVGRADDGGPAGAAA